MKPDIVYLPCTVIGAHGVDLPDGPVEVDVEYVSGDDVVPIFGVPREDIDEHRAALTRALVGQAWAVACCWLEDVGREHIICPDYSCFPHLERTAALLAPAEVAAEILGGTR